MYLVAAVIIFIMIMKWGNWALAKIIEILYLSTQLDDVGCTYKLIYKETLDKSVEVYLFKSNMS